MIKFPKHTINIFFLLLLSNILHAQALHWLSQPDIDIGPIANNETFDVKISSNGVYASFKSRATNLVENDNNELVDVFIRNLEKGTTQIVSTTNNGSQFTDGDIKSISAPTSDGRYVAFVGTASELPGSTGFSSDEYLYVKDLQTGIVTNHSDYNGGIDFFDASVFDIHLSDDGQYVTFSTTDQISILHTNTQIQVYRKHLTTDTFELISISHDGLQSANQNAVLSDVSDNGRYVLFSTDANNITNDVINNFGDNLYINDTQSNTMTLVNITPAGTSSATTNYSTNETAISNNAQVVFKSIQSDLVINDNNERYDVFYYDNGTITRINLTDNNEELSVGVATSFNVSISGNGSRIAFSEYSDDIFSDDTNDAYDLYSYETANGNLTLISKNINGNKSNGDSLHPDLSTNGNTIVFLSKATDLVSSPIAGGYEDLYHYQFSSDEMKIVTIAISNLETILSGTYYPRTSSDQLSVVYSSSSPNLAIEPDDNLSQDLFLLDRTTNTHSKVASEIVNNGDISASGRFVSFTTQYFPPDGLIDLGAENVFLYDRENNTYTQIEEGHDSKVNNNGIVVFSTNKGIDINDTNSNLDAYYYNPSSQSIVLLSKDMSENATSINQIDGFDIGGSDNNTWVTFSSLNDNIVVNDNNAVFDIFLKKIPNGNITRISRNIAGVEANNSSPTAAISENSNFIVFSTFATNLTLDDYSNAYPAQFIVYDRINNQLFLASKNDSGVPLISSATANISSVRISDSGRFISYTYRDKFGSNGENFVGDIDTYNDTVLFDTATQLPKIISKHPDDSHSDDYTEYTSHVVEDLTVSPSLVGVAFAASGGDLTNIPNHPGHQEAFLYQQGGPDLNLNIIIEGAGSVVGTSGINCSDNCQYDFSIGSELTLTALPENNIQFIGWLVDFGNCVDDSNPCELTMDREKTLTAIFFDPSDVIYSNGFENL